MEKSKGKRKLETLKGALGKTKRGEEQQRKFCREGTEREREREKEKERERERERERE